MAFADDTVVTNSKSEQSMTVSERELNRLKQAEDASNQIDSPWYQKLYNGVASTASSAVDYVSNLSGRQLLSTAKSITSSLSGSRSYDSIKRGFSSTSRDPYSAANLALNLASTVGRSLFNDTSNRSEMNRRTGISSPIVESYNRNPPPNGRFRSTDPDKGALGPSSILKDLTSGISSLRRQDYGRLVALAARYASNIPKNDTDLKILQDKAMSENIRQFNPLNNDISGATNNTPSRFDFAIDNATTQMTSDFKSAIDSATNSGIIGYGQDIADNFYARPDQSVINLKTGSWDKSYGSLSANQLRATNRYSKDSFGISCFSDSNEDVYRDGYYDQLNYNSMISYGMRNQIPGIVTAYTRNNSTTKRFRNQSGFGSMNSSLSRLATTIGADIAADVVESLGLGRIANPRQVARSILSVTNTRGSSSSNIGRVLSAVGTGFDGLVSDRRTSSGRIIYNQRQMSTVNRRIASNQIGWDQYRTFEGDPVTNFNRRGLSVERSSQISF